MITRHPLSMSMTMTRKVSMRASSFRRSWIRRERPRLELGTLFILWLATWKRPPRSHTRSFQPSWSHWRWKRTVSAKWKSMVVALRVQPNRRFSPTTLELERIQICSISQLSVVLLRLTRTLWGWPYRIATSANRSRSPTRAASLKSTWRTASVSTSKRWRELDNFWVPILMPAPTMKSTNEQRQWTAPKRSAIDSEWEEGIKHRPQPISLFHQEIESERG